MFYQPDLFEPKEASHDISDMSDLIERISITSRRPRYVLLVLNLIVKAAGQRESVGPYVEEKGKHLPIRDWLSLSLASIAHRDCRRLAMIEAARGEIMADRTVAENPSLLQARLEKEVQARILRSGRTNVSRAVSDLVQAGLIKRHYQGYRTNHINRGAQREAVYMITPAARQILRTV